MSGISLHKLADESVNAHKLQHVMRTGAYAYCIPGKTVLASVAATGVIPGAGTTNVETRSMIVGAGKPIPYSLYPIGAATIVNNRFVSGSGLILTLDATNAEGAELVIGGYDALNPWRYTIGSDLGAFIKITMAITTVANSTDCAVGWRKYEAAQLAIDDYADMACLNIKSGTVYIDTIVAAAATASVSTTDTVLGAAYHTYEVRWIGTKTYFYVDGAQPTVTVSTHRFTAADVIVPFIYALNAAGANSAIYLRDIEVGPMAAVNANG